MRVDRHLQVQTIILVATGAANTRLGSRSHDVGGRESRANVAPPDECVTRPRDGVAVDVHDRDSGRVPVLERTTAVGHGHIEIDRAGVGDHEPAPGKHLAHRRGGGEIVDRLGHGFFLAVTKPVGDDSRRDANTRLGVADIVLEGEFVGNVPGHCVTLLQFDEESVTAQNGAAIRRVVEPTAVARARVTVDGSNQPFVVMGESCVDESRLAPHDLACNLIDGLIGLKNNDDVVSNLSEFRLVEGP
mmetsp:Transcript_6811/g.23746  ORF Transcript_6811/g.23746 Transcript_6811/m.23746 type:complete len:245 (-) Transcript_6811:2061-2795(-)